MKWLDWNMECQCLPLNFNNQNISKTKITNSLSMFFCFWVLFLETENTYAVFFHSNQGTRSSKPKVWIPHGPWCSRDDPYGWFPMTGSKVGRLSWIWVVMTCDVSISCKMCSKKYIYQRVIIGNILGSIINSIFDSGGDHKETYYFVPVFALGRPYWSLGTKNTFTYGKYRNMKPFQVENLFAGSRRKLFVVFSTAAVSQESEPMKIKEFCDRGKPWAGRQQKHVWNVSETCRMERMDVMEFPGILLNVLKGWSLKMEWDNEIIDK